MLNGPPGPGADDPSILAPRAGDEVPDGDLADAEGGEVEDGEVEDGEVEDGEVEDGEVEDGEVEDGEVEDGEVEDGEVEDGEVEDDDSGGSDADEAQGAGDLDPEEDPHPEETRAWAAWVGSADDGDRASSGDEGELYDLELEPTAALPRITPAATSLPPPTPAAPPPPASLPPAAGGAGKGSGPGPGGRRAPTRKPSKVPRAVLLKQRARRRRAMIGFTFFTAACVILTGSSFLYLQHKLGQIQRVTLPSLVEDQPGEVMNVLLVGSDSRDRLEGDDALQAGKGQEDVNGQRSDTIMVLHIDPEKEQAAILSIPRDVVVPIAGTNLTDRVNAAFSFGGAEGLIATIQQSLGITINHYVEVDFVGFKDIVDAVGGVEIYLPRWARDFTSGLDLPKIGCFSVNGTQGLAFVRSRHYEELVDGKWITDATGDFGRINRQQDFIRRMLKKALSTGITNPIQLNKLISIGINDVTIDETLSTKDIALLGRRFNNLDPDNVLQYTLPAVPEFIDGKSAMRLMETEAEQYIEFINGNVSAIQPVVAPPGGPADTTATTVAHGDIAVQVLNGIGTAGAAGTASTALKDVGYKVTGTGDSPKLARTTIRHPAAAVAKAQTLQAGLAAGAELSADEDVTGSDVVLVLGADYEGLKSASGTPSTLAGEEGTTTPTVTGAAQGLAGVNVRVLNGIGTAGAAAKASTALKEAGYSVSGTGDSSRVGRTTIRHRVGTLPQAKQLQESLQSGAELAVDTTLGEGELDLILGADYAGLKGAPVEGQVPVATTTTSIAPPTTVPRDPATDC